MSRVERSDYDRFVAWWEAVWDAMVSGPPVVEGLDEFAGWVR